MPLLSIFTTALLALIIKGLLVSIHNNLSNYSFTQLISGVKLYLLLLLVPLGINIVNHFNSPEIRPFKSFLACLNGSEEPFFAVDICKQPQSDLYALTDVRGRLAVAKRGETPTVIYQGEKDDGNLLSKLLWSPNGAKILFNENGGIKVLSMSQKDPVLLADGALAFWSADSEVLLVAAKTTPAQGINYSVPFNHYRLSYVSTATKEVHELSGNLSFPGSSMFWHSGLNVLLAVTDLWQIAFMNLNNGQVEMINLPPPSVEPGPIFLTKIAPTGADSYRVAVFTDLKTEPVRGKVFATIFYSMIFSVPNKTALLGSFENLKIPRHLNQRDGIKFGDNSFGAYHRIISSFE